MQWWISQSVAKPSISSRGVGHGAGKQPGPDARQHHPLPNTTPATWLNIPPKSKTRISWSEAAVLQGGSRTDRYLNQPRQLANQPLRKGDDVAAPVRTPASIGFGDIIPRHF